MAKIRKIGWFQFVRYRDYLDKSGLIFIHFICKELLLKLSLKEAKLIT